MRSRMRQLPSSPNQKAKDKMNDDRIIKTYVWHGDKCFFVSTISRDSSAMLGPGRYNETIVWEYNLEKAERGLMLWQAEDSLGSIRKHQRIVEALFQRGTARDYAQDE